MIEQYTIATTPKYNFPQQTMDTALPRRFIELSLHSLKSAENQLFQLNQQTIQQTPNISELQAQGLQLKMQPIQLKPRHENCVVAAVDTSSMKIGETSTGILVAVRGAIVWRQNGNYRYLRLGPFVFHVTEENKKEVYSSLQSAYFNTRSEHVHQGLMNLLQMPTRIANLLERWLQAMLSKTTKEGLILFDGSLTAGTADTPICLMKEILHNARGRGNIVLAFSKMTNLRVNGRLITELPSEHKSPYLLETVGLKARPPVVLFGDVYVARLNHGNCAFRLDVDKEIPSEQQIRGVEKLLANDSLLQGYPETLRLAHIVCTFTANEVIAMQHFITRRYQLKIVDRPNMHRLLFGPFGKGENSS